jgi:hypothetical protein
LESEDELKAQELMDSVPEYFAFLESDSCGEGNLGIDYLCDEFV